MKKRILSLFMLVTVAICAIVSLSACGGKTYNGEGYNITRDKSNSVFDYDASSDTTYAEIPVRIENLSDSNIKGVSFIADFKNSSGKTVYSNTIILSHEDYNLDIRPGTTYYVTLEFYKGSEFGAIRGNATSVNFRPYTMTLDEEGAKDNGEKTFGILEIVIAVLCVGAIVLGIWLTYDGFYLGLDWLRRYPEDIAKPVFGILLMVASVGWAIAYYFFIW